MKSPTITELRAVQSAAPTESTLKLTAVSDGYIVRDGKRVTIAPGRGTLQLELEAWLEESFSHGLGSES